MRIGVPRETHADERRVATTPDVAQELIKMGFSVAVESGAGAAGRGSETLGPRRGAAREARRWIGIQVEADDLGRLEGDDGRAIASTRQQCEAGGEAAGDRCAVRDGLEGVDGTRSVARVRSILLACEGRSCAAHRGREFGVEGSIVPRRHHGR